MDGRRLGWTMAVVAAALLLVLWYANRRSAEGEAQRQARGSPSSASRPIGSGADSASRPASSPARDDAALGAASSPAAETAPERDAEPGPPSSPAARPEWKYLADPSAPDTISAGSLDPASGYMFELEFDRHGAAVRTLKLAASFATVDDRLLYDRLGRDHARYQQERARDLKTYRGHYSLLNPVGGYLPYATRSITVSRKSRPGESSAMRLDGIRWQYLGTKAVTRPAQGVEVVFAATLYRDVNHDRPDKPADYRPHLRIAKTYTVARDDYSFLISLEVENLGSEEVKFSIDQLGPTGVPREDRRADCRLAAYGKLLTQDRAVQVFLKRSQEVQDKEKKQDASTGRSYQDYKLPTDQPHTVGVSDEGTPTLWIGHVNKFFGSMMYLRPTVAGRMEAPELLADFYIIPAPESPESRAFVTGIRLGAGRSAVGGPDLVLGAGGQARTIAFDVFAGPKKRDMLTRSGSPRFRQMYKDLNYIGTIDFSGCCSWAWLTLGMMWLLQASSVVTFGNYGLAIILLVILVRAALHPLTKRSQLNMMKAQKLQPELAKLKKKYADDKEMLQKESMRLYKEHGAAPLLGCLPMLLQMPIWIALWNSLNAAVELRHAGLLPVWITDLAGPDAIWGWETPFSIPLIGSLVGPISSINLLPILLTVAMVLQTKLNPQMSQPTAPTTPEQEQQQKIFKVMMPVMMLLLFYPAPSGLTLYVMTSTFAGVLEQWVIKRHVEARQAAEAAATTTVKLPGKGPRATRPKKPRGPLWFKRG